MQIHIAGTGIWYPEETINNEEIVSSYNSYEDHFNNTNKDKIERGILEKLDYSSTEFIEKASGIKHRYVIEKDHALDPNFMKPLIPARDIDELSILAEIGVMAGKDAMENADVTPDDIDAVIEVLKSDFLTQGPKVPEFENALRDFCSVNYVKVVSNATAALHVAYLAIGLKQGDIVWTTPNTYVATANAALYCGAEVDFVDIDARTYNMSILSLEEKLKLAWSASPFRVGLVAFPSNHNVVGL